MIAQLVNNLTAVQKTWFDSWVRKICWRRDRLPAPIFLGFPCGSAGKESACNVGDLGLIPGLGRSPGEGKGYPLQYSGLENSMGNIVHGVTKSWTWLGDFHFQVFMDSISGLLPRNSFHSWSTQMHFNSRGSRRKGFPGGIVVENPLDNAGNTRDAALIHGLWSSPGVANVNSLQYGQRSLAATVHGVTEIWTQLRIHTHAATEILYFYLASNQKKE